MLNALPRLNRRSLIAAGGRVARSLGLRAAIARHMPRLAAPVNYSAPDPAHIDRDVAYALQVAANCLGHVEAMGARLEGSALLELGPGFEFGPQLILASHGARVTVADRFLARWSDTYHPAFYRALRSKWKGPSSALDRVIAEGRYHPDVITCIEEPAETLPSIEDRSCDIVISNAVLEHVFDFAAVAKTLSRVSRAGGLHSHQIDFRDHRNFDKPLEFLLMADAEFGDESRLAHMQCGNRWRLSDVVRLFQAAGFSVEHIERNGHNDPRYVAAFVPRLRSSRSTFRETPLDDLECGGARLVLRHQGST